MEKKLKGYEEKTRDRVVNYFLKCGIAYFNQLKRLGTKEFQVDQNSLNKIIEDLKLENKVIENSDGSVRMFVWIGGKK